MSIARLMRMGAAGIPNPVTLDSTTFDTLTSGTFPFNYAKSYPAGTLVVVIVTARENDTIAGTWDSVVDDEGNTFNLVVQGTQNNDLTFSAIWKCSLSNPVTAATAITATTSTTLSTAGRHAAIFVLTPSPPPTNVVNSPQTGAPVVATLTTTSGSGIAFHVVSTGLGGPPSVVSVSSGFTLQVESRNAGCSQYIATSVLDQAPSSSVSNSLELSTTTGQYANMMAVVGSAGTTNLLLNSSPFSGTSNWTAVNSAISESGGVLAVDDNGAFGAANQAVAVTIGVTYTLTGTYYTDGTAGQIANFGIRHGDRVNIAEASEQAAGNYSGTSPLEATFDFIATDSFVTVKLASVSDNLSYFKDVTLTEA